LFHLSPVANDGYADNNLMLKMLKI